MLLNVSFCFFGSLNIIIITGKLTYVVNAYFDLQYIRGVTIPSCTVD